MNLMGFMHCKHFIYTYMHTYDSCYDINIHENYVIMSILQKLIVEVML